MTYFGHVRDYLPRLSLALPTRSGGQSIVEFIVDTAFEGDLALPMSIIEQLDVVPLKEVLIRLADGTHRLRPRYSMVLDWNGSLRRIEITVAENNPLLGVYLLAESVFTAEMTDGGEVSVEAL